MGFARLSRPRYARARRANLGHPYGSVRHGEMTTWGRSFLARVVMERRLHGLDPYGAVRRVEMATGVSAALGLVMKRWLYR